mmetsp:Transcript_40436/g.95004  ORF Transcript_40436/g.95004 Transcript_40436/m.95004 type:complete len:205 (+) Transcript_40436:528-1142(+)
MKAIQHLPVFVRAEPHDVDGETAFFFRALVLSPEVASAGEHAVSLELRPVERIRVLLTSLVVAGTAGAGVVPGDRHDLPLVHVHHGRQERKHFPPPTRVKALGAVPVLGGYVDVDVRAEVIQVVRSEGVVGALHGQVGVVVRNGLEEEPAVLEVFLRPGAASRDEEADRGLLASHQEFTGLVGAKASLVGRAGASEEEEEGEEE